MLHLVAFLTHKISVSSGGWRMLVVKKPTPTGILTTSNLSLMSAESMVVKALAPTDILTTNDSSIPG